ncbi:Serine/threonine-protein phosphatase 7 long form homolog [Linum perenne]
MRLDHDLITALIERWRSETHTFHMPEGECTVILQNANIISGLPINGAYMLCLIGGFLFPNKSTQYVHLMWLPLLEDFTSVGSLSWGFAC